MKKALGLALLSGILVGTSWPPFKAWALAFCLVPLFLAWSQCRSWREAFMVGWISQFTFTLIGFHWIAFTASEFGHLNKPLSYLVLFAFCCFANLHVAFAGAFAVLLRNKCKFSQPRFLLVAALLYPVVEWFYPQIFPWNLGFSLLYSKLKIAQLAEYIGFWGLGLFVCLINALLAKCWIQKKNGQPWLTPLFAVILLLAAAEMLGNLCYQRVPAEDRHIKLLVVQPNVGNFEKAFAERGAGYQLPIAEDLFASTTQLLNQFTGARPDLIIWPETAYPASLDAPFSQTLYAQRLRNFTSSVSIPLLTGAYSEDVGSRANQTYNGVFLLDEKGETKASYRKTILLAFGEYIPGARFFPALKQLMPEISDFSPGSGPTTFSLGDIKLGIQICYEGLDPIFVRDISRQGAQIHVNLTNDSWFGPVFEPVQHMIMTMARSIETRRPVVRVTNTGITTAIDARGKFLFEGPVGQAWGHLFEVGFHSQPILTFYTQFASFLPVLILIILGLVILESKRPRNT